MTGEAPSAPGDALRTRARLSAESGRHREAADDFRSLLRLAPDDVEALNYLAVQALAGGRVEEARGLLQQAITTHPRDVPTRKNHGVLLLRTGRLGEAEQAFRELIGDDPGFFTGRLYRGMALERLGDPRAAATEYFRAVSNAQSQGYWTSPATTPPGIRPLVEHAMVAARVGRRQRIDELMAPIVDRFGREALQRVERCLASHLGEAPLAPPDRRQKAQFLYFPDLPSEPVLALDLFPWREELEAASAEIRSELLAVLGDRPQLEPFLGRPPPGMKSSYLDGSRETATPQWDAYFFYRHGRGFDTNIARCPQTVAALDRTSIVRIRQHSPEALFSVLGPGSHILPHTGVTNTRVVTHLPLIVPDDCRLRVADHVHAWEPGHCFMFDDTFEHEAWNRSGETRVILLFDVWNPYLHEEERLALTELVAAMGDLDAEVV